MEGVRSRENIQKRKSNGRHDDGNQKEDNGERDADKVGKGGTYGREGK